MSLDIDNNVQSVESTREVMRKRDVLKKAFKNIWNNMRDEVKGAKQEIGDIRQERKAQKAQEPGIMDKVKANENVQSIGKGLGQVGHGVVDVGKGLGGLAVDGVGAVANGIYGPLDRGSERLGDAIAKGCKTAKGSMESAKGSVRDKVEGFKQKRAEAKAAAAARAKEKAERKERERQIKIEVDAKKAQIRKIEKEIDAKEIRLMKELKLQEGREKANQQYEKNVAKIQELKDIGSNKIENPNTFLGKLHNGAVRPITGAFLKSGRNKVINNVHKTLDRTELIEKLTDEIAAKREAAEKIKEEIRALNANEAKSGVLNGWDKFKEELVNSFNHDPSTVEGVIEDFKKKGYGVEGAREFIKNMNKSA